MARKKTLRQLRKLLKRRKRSFTIKDNLEVFSRLVKRLRFKFLRYFVYFCFRLWLKKVHNEGLLPKEGPAIIVSNHLSYYDWGILSAIYWDRYLAFIGNKDLLNRGFVGWLMRLNMLIFIDPKKPGLTFLKEALRKLKEENILVIYPEGSRSKTGRMLEPRRGFIKIALKTGAPIIPIGMKGTYSILPPHKVFPRFKRCEVFVGPPILLNRRHPLFKDLFHLFNGEYILSEEGESVAARRIMEIIKEMTGQEWEDEGDPT